MVCAHIIESIRPVKRRRGAILVYENVLLIRAKDDEEAMRKARKRAEASNVSDDSATINGKPAVWSFVGIRKIVAVMNPAPLDQEGNEPVDGTEITYSKFEVKDERALSKLIDGKEIVVRYLE